MSCSESNPCVLDGNDFGVSGPGSLRSSHFPNAPEKLAEHLGVIVHASPMVGCDGWCLATDAKAIIRINSDLQLHGAALR